MKKKAPAGRVTEKGKTAKIIKKIKADLTSSPKPNRGKRKEVKKSPPQKKASRKKVPSRVSAKKGPVKNKAEIGKTKKKSIKKVSPKREKPPVIKAGTKKKVKPVSGKAKTITTGKPGTRLTGKEQAIKKEKSEKKPVKARTGKKPSILKSEGKRAAPAPAVKPRKKAKVAAGVEAASKSKPEKRKKQPAEGKKKAVFSKEIKKEKVLKIFKPEFTGKEKKKIKAGGKYKVKGLTDKPGPKTGALKEEREEKTAYSEGAEVVSPVPLERLPSEYGENSISLITVNPCRVFAFWEVREDTLKIFQGTLMIRLYDITDIDFDCRDANSYVDSEVSERVGDLYLDVSPAKDYVADIGILYSGGIFITIARSHKTSTPASSHEPETCGITANKQGESTEKQVETDIRIGY